MIGPRHRRGTRGKTILVDGIPECAIPNTEPVQTPTQVIDMRPGPNADMDALADAAMAAELARYEREGAPARDQDDFLDSIFGNAPEEWISEDVIHSEAAAQDRALSYVRYLEAEVDRRGGSRKPPWTQPPAAGDGPLFESLVAELGAEKQFGLPVPPAESTTKGTGSEGREGETAASPPGAAETSSRPGDGDTEPGDADGKPVQDEPDAEPDCGEGSETA